MADYVAKHHPTQDNEADHAPQYHDGHHPGHDAGHGTDYDHHGHPADHDHHSDHDHYDERYLGCGESPGDYLKADEQAH